MGRDMTKRRATNQKWRERNPDKEATAQRRSHLRRTYGLTPEQYAEMYDEQEGVCAICQLREATCIDHDHETGLVRALLCRRCNTGIGQFGDDPDLLVRAVGYLTRP
jgi:hypothetical protein